MDDCKQQLKYPLNVWVLLKLLRLTHFCAAIVHIESFGLYVVYSWKIVPLIRSYVSGVTYFITIDE